MTNRMLLLAVTLVTLTGCTFVRYVDPEGRTVLVTDLHPVGGATDLTLEKSDGTKLSVTRGQGSSAGIIADVADALAVP